MLQSPIKKLRTTFYQERINELKAQTSRTQAEEQEMEELKLCLELIEIKIRFTELKERLDHPGRCGCELCERARVEIAELETVGENSKS